MTLPSRDALALTLVLACASLVGCPPAAAPAPDRPPPQVKVATPLVKTIVEWDAYTGRLQAVESVQVRSRVSGYLKSVHFAEGQLIEAGQVLFVIDPRPFEVAYDRARAAVQQAQAAVAAAKARQAQSEADRGRVAAQVGLAQIRQKRAADLLKAGTSTQEDLDQRRSELTQARASLTAADAAIRSAEAAVNTANSDLAAARAGLAGARLDLTYTQIKAEISGRVDRRLVTAGNYIEGGTANATLLTTIVSLDPIHCMFDASEQALLKYTRLASAGARKSSREVKNPAYIALIDETGFPHAGHMDFVGNQVDVATATMRGRAIFANPDLLLVPGLFARVRIPGSAPHEVILIPDAAVGSDQSEQYVMVLGADDKVERRVVTLGPKHRGLRIVRAGLTADARLIVTGLQFVRAGETVQAEPTQLSLQEEPHALPNHYEPLPKEKWLGAAPSPPPPPPPLDPSAGKRD